MTIVYEYCKISYVMGVMAISDEIKMPIKATTSKLSIYFFIKNLSLLVMEGRNPPYNSRVSANSYRGRGVPITLLYILIINYQYK